MNAVNVLKALLSSSSIESGRVVSVEDNTVTVATSKGRYVVQKQAGDITPYKLNDTVRIKNQFLIGRSADKNRSIKYPIE